MPGSEDNFPEFADGDVLVVITAARRYKLHSAVLRRASPIFSALFDKYAGADLTSKMKRRGVSIKYRLHLTENPKAGAREAGVLPPPHCLERVMFDESGNPSGDYPALLGDANEKGRVVPQSVLVSPPLYYNGRTTELTILGMGASAWSLLQPQHRHWRHRAGWHFVHSRICRHSFGSSRVPRMRKSIHIPSIQRHNH